MATVTVNRLECGTNYTIAAGGTLINGDLVGPRLFLGDIAESCSSRGSGRDDDGGKYVVIFSYLANERRESCR